MRILVTGGTGFIGSNIVKELMKDGHDIIITGHDAENKIPGFKGKILQPSFVGIDWDAIGKVDVVFHQAAINDTTNQDWDEMYRANVVGTVQLFKHVIANGCKRIIYASSCAVYGDAPAPFVEGGVKNPLNAYGRSKYEVDKIVEQMMEEHPDVRFIGLRYSNVIGPGEGHQNHRRSMILQWAHQMLEGNPKLFTDGTQKRDIVYVADVVKANLLAMQCDESCIVNVGSGKARSFNDIVAALNSVMGLNREPEYINNPYGSFFQTFTECDLTLAQEKLGYEPDYDLEAGIKAYWESGGLPKP